MYLLKNGLVHVGDGTVIPDCDILTEGRVITKVGKGLDEADAEIIDVSGCDVFPGFIDPVSSIGAMGLPARYAGDECKVQHRSGRGECAGIL